jgi:uncharacterized protein (DUF1501 family)
MKRRDFLKSTGLASAALFVPQFLQAMPRIPFDGKRNKRLVVIQLSGGNDGLNTVVPYNNDLYYKSRPSIAIKKDLVLRLDNDCGLHPSLSGLRSLYDNGNLAIINSVGYPNPNRSHFRSMDIWQTASASEEYLSHGWIGRYLDSMCAGCATPASAIELDDSLSLAMKGHNLKGLAMSDIDKLHKLAHSKFIEHHVVNDYVHDHPTVDYLYKTLIETSSSVDSIYAHSKTFRSMTPYPAQPLGKKMKSIAELIVGGSPTSVYYISLGGFDTHVSQPGTQQRLFNQLSQSIDAFCKDLRDNKMFDDTLIMVFSEFGRRVAENAGKGTDHGTANTVFLIGGNIKQAGRYNAMPDLTNLDNGDLKYSVDFRDIYATILEKWLDTDYTSVLGEKFNLLPILG